MILNFKPTKVPKYEIVDSAGIRYPYRVGTTDSDTHYKVTKNKVTFRVKKEVYIKQTNDEKVIFDADYFLYIEYQKEIIVKEEVNSFEDGFLKANEWANNHLNDIQYLNSLVWEIREKKHYQVIEDEKVDTMQKAKSIKFPYFSKYSDKYIYDIIETDLGHCIAYYAGNLSTNDFDFSSIGVSQLNYSPSTERTKSYNCIKYLLDTLYPNISNDLESYFKDISIEDASNMLFLSGKYKGETLLNVYKENPSYIDWYLQNTSKTIYNVRMLNAMSLIKEQL